MKAVMELVFGELRSTLASNGREELSSGMIYVESPGVNALLGSGNSFGLN